MNNVASVMDRALYGSSPERNSKCGAAHAEKKMMTARRILEDAKPYACQKCRRRFRNPAAMRLHERNCAGIIPARDSEVC